MRLALLYCLAFGSFFAGWFANEHRHQPPAKVWVHKDYVWVSNDRTDLHFGPIDIRRTSPTSSVIEITVTPKEAAK